MALRYLTTNPSRLVLLTCTRGTASSTIESCTSRESFIVEYHGNACSHLYHAFISCWLLDLGNTSRSAFWFRLLRAPSVCPIVTSHVLLLQHFDIIENNNIGNNAAIPLVEKFKLFTNIYELITLVQSKQLTARFLNQWFAQEHAWK